MSILARPLSQTLLRLVDAHSAELEHAVQQLVEALEAGHVCLSRDMLGPAACEALLASPLVGRPGEFKPILYQLDRFYLARYWHYEQQLAQGLLQRLQNSADWSRPDSPALLARLFAGSQQQPDWQCVAVAASLRQGLTILSGGPGTGKSRTVFNMLCALQLSAPQSLRIRLAAPTGKAAARLAESLRLTAAQVLPGLPEDWQVALQGLPQQAETLHRLLQPRPDRIGYRYHASNPLPLDVLVVDEASMVDVSLMAHLLDALPVDARLILLGDKDQLSSVEAGSVFADLCADAGLDPQQAESLSRLTGHVILPRAGRSQLGNAVQFLHHSYRFAGDAGIGQLARHINAGQEDAVLAVLQHNPDLHWHTLSRVVMLEQLTALFADYFAAVRQGDVSACFAALDAVRVLAALHEGPDGTQQLNAQLAYRFANRGWIRAEPRYPGLPVLVQQNDYSLQLYNGDLGIMLPDAQGQLKVWFAAEGGGWRALPPARLPPHEPAYVMTVHKSQGSEFSHVALVLPEQASPLLSRPLLYTAVTRARRQVTLFGHEARLREAVRLVPLRHSGLVARLRQEDES
ncbi:exodeoxyribonuclease V subunit alpha [Leeia aquatica]|uniref:RecBCD enzyme subunit RecD n=1 Tax=Leeia aquatica TaxID=2725557 RepID=A0A847S3M5_9NEIS|nr:exodeoxyribonuclease V subunit alpha [Leeia aquatica]NLR73767.1 exodeoxyribonuclease V subunit alpha [Leeia aquatica]